MIVVPGLMPLIVITIGTYNYTSTLNLILYKGSITTFH